MASLALGVRFNPVSAGTADFVYSGAVTGYTNPTGLADGASYRYRAESGDLSQWEWGSGTWTAASSTLARTTVLLSSNANSKVGFSSQPQVSIVIFPADILQFDAAMSLTAAQQAQGRANISANENQAYAENTSFTTFTTTMAGGVNTVPAITDGTQILSVSHTASLATNNLMIEVNGTISTGAGANYWAALFQGSTCIAAVQIGPGGGNLVQSWMIQVEAAANVNTAQTYTVRMGNFTGGSNTIAINGTPAGQRLGGAMRQIIRIRELKQ